MLRKRLLFLNIISIYLTPAQQVRLGEMALMLQSFLNEFSRTFLKNDILSIDIGYTNIKIIHSRKKNKDLLKVINFGIGSTPAGCIRNGIISDLDGIAENLKRIIDMHGMNEKNVKIVISAGSNIVSKIIFVSGGSHKNIEENIRVELERQMPVDISRHKLFYRITGTEAQGRAERHRVLVTIVPNTTIDNYVRLTRHLNLRPVSIDIPFSSVARFFAKGVRVRDMNAIGWSNVSLEIEKSTTAIIDLGSETTNLSILNNGTLEFNRILLTGGYSIDLKLSKRLGIDLNMAERYKVLYGFISRGQKEDKIGRLVDACLREELSEIFANIKRSMEFYHNHCGGKKVERMVMIGGGSGLKGLREFAEEVTGIPVYTLDTLDLDNVEFDEGLDEGKIRYLVSALGIAM